MSQNFFICSTSPCLERRLDCQKIYDYLVRNNWHPVKKLSHADLIIISTCSFGKAEDDSSIQLINYYAKNNSNSAKIIIAGCISKINPSKLNQIGQFLTISPETLNRLDNIIEPKTRFDCIKEPNRISALEVPYKPILKSSLSAINFINNFFNQTGLKVKILKKCLNSTINFINYSTLLRSRIHPLLADNRDKFFYIRISRGCLGSCSYCAKRFATGILISKTIEDIIDEFREGLNIGYKMFFLLSEDFGCYGRDIGKTAYDLLKEIFRIGRGVDFKIVISNFNAHWFVKDYKEIKILLAENKNKIFYIHIPIQSASNGILKLMNRPYCIEDVIRCLYDIKKEIPYLDITTDMITGFPGETENDFNKSLDFLQKIKFRYADIFGYEDRPNTLANKMLDKLSQEVIEKRKIDLVRIQNQNSKTKTIIKKIIEISKTRDFL